MDLFNSLFFCQGTHSCVANLSPVLDFGYSSNAISKLN